MKIKLSLALPFLLVLFTSFQCGKDKDLKRTYTGRLEVKGPCGHYTVSVLKGRMERDLIEPLWTNPNNGQSYKRVFAVGNSCSFPANELNAGDTFEFTIGGKPQNCMVCQIYYPAPEKKIPITVTKIINKKASGKQ